jgi:ATP-dependent DNA helicase RecG
MRIVSPGGFPEGVNVNNILTVAPTTRNILLVEASKRIGLAERTGRGIDKIYASMLRSGHGIPDYSSSTDISVVLCLDSSEVDKEFVKILVSEQKRLNKELPVDVLIILSVLKQERRATLENLAIRIQKRTVEAKSTVEWLLEQGLVEGVGNGPARRYMLSSAIYAAINNATGYTRQKGWDTIQEQEMIISYIDTYHKITRSDVIDLCRCNENHATWLLRKLVKENKIVLSGRGKYAYYQKKD